MATTISDTDGDSMPDWWEMTNGLDPADPVYAVVSDDGDFAPAFFEFQMGGSPLVDDSVFYNTMLGIATAEPSEGPWVYRNPATGTISFKMDIDQSENLTMPWSQLNMDAPEVSVTTNGNQVVIEYPIGSETKKFFRFER